MSQPPNNLPEERIVPGRDDVTYIQPNETESPAQRLLWGAGGAGGCLLLLLVIFLGLLFVVTGSVNQTLQRFNDVTNFVVAGPPTPQASVVTSQTIVNRIQPLGQLVSTSAQLAKADIEVSIAQGRFAACDHAANHVAAGTIEAGIDLLGVDPEDIVYDAETDTYTVTLPQPQLTSCRIDFIDQYERARNLPTCAVDWDDARQIAQFTALVEFRDDSVEGGILETAGRDAQSVLTGFLSALTDSTVVVEFEDSRTPLPTSCEPEPPRDWQYESGTRQWVKIR